MDQKYALKIMDVANRIKFSDEFRWLRILGVREQNYDVRYLLKSLNSSSVYCLTFGGNLDEPLSGEEVAGFYFPVLEFVLSINNVTLTN